MPKLTRSTILTDLMIATPLVLGVGLFAAGCESSSDDGAAAGDGQTQQRAAISTSNATGLEAVYEQQLVRADGSTVSGERLKDAEYVVFYSSAAWCGPCRAFTPNLIDFYKKNGGGETLEVVLVSSDRNADAAQAYLSEYPMPWTMLPFDVGRSQLGRELRSGSGIPDLVVVKPATGEVVSTAFASSGEYRGPNAVLNDLRVMMATN